MKIYPWVSVPIVLILSCILNNSAIGGLFNRPDFFEKGHEQFEEEIRRFDREETVPNSSLEVDETALPWSRIIMGNVGFTAMVPPGAITHEVETVEASEGNINFDIIATHPSSSRYVIAYSEAVTTERFANTQEVLERSRDYIIDNEIGLVKVADDDITFENYPGKEFKLQNKDETIIFRLLLVGQRLYILAVSQESDGISQELVDTFFDSFQLI